VETFVRKVRKKGQYGDLEVVSRHLTKYIGKEMLVIIVAEEKVRT
jgi:hypothetical protein